MHSVLSEVVMLRKPLELGSVDSELICDRCWPRGICSTDIERVLHGNPDVRKSNCFVWFFSQDARYSTLKHYRRVIASPLHATLRLKSFMHAS